MGAEPVTIDDVEAVVTRVVSADGVRPDRIGIEAEWFPLRRVDGRRIGLAATEPLIRTGTDLTPRPGINPSWVNAAGGAITYEPGGQIEHSGIAHPTVPEAYAELAATHAALTTALAGGDVMLVPAGIDHWNPISRVDQQLAGPRYPAMAEYFERRGTSGPLMMRHTCSIQINLDAGEAGTARRRWAVAKRVSPVLTALFSTSPADTMHSRRAEIWQQLDPTRTGFPPSSDLEIDPAAAIAGWALDADVLVIVRPEGAIAGRPGWTLHDWLTEGHPTAGFPTTADVEYHLTTLFPEVRLRGGVLEFRAIDALPRELCTFPALLLAGLVYDDDACDRALDATDGLDLDALWRRAALHGVADAEVGRLVRSIAAIATDGVRALGVDRTGDLVAFERFAEIAGTPGSTVADDIRHRLATDPLGAARHLADH